MWTSSRLLSYIFLFVFLHLINYSFAQEQNELDSLQQALSTTHDVDLQLELLTSLSDKMVYVDANQARKYGFQAIKIAEELENDKALAIINRNIGVTHEGQGNYDSALYYQKLSLTQFNSLGDSIEIAGAYNNIGVIYDEKGENDIATDYYLKAARIYETLNDTDGMARVYNNIGIIYKKSSRYEKALEFYKKALDIYNSKEHLLGIAVSHSNIGSVYLQLQDYKESLKYSYLAVELYKKANLQQYVPYAFENIGVAYQHLQQLDSAVLYHSKALELYKSYGNQKEMASTLNSLAKINLQNGKENKALNYARESLIVSSEIGANEEFIDAQQILARISYYSGNFKEAYHFLETYLLLKDSLDNIYEATSIAEMQEKYETEKKEQEIKILKAETKIKDYELSASRNRFLALAVISGLVLMIGVLITSRRSLKQKALLAEERQKQHKRQLKAMVEAEEKERKRIAAELHDGVGQQLTGIKMAFETLSKNLKNENKEVNTQLQNLTNYLHESSDEIRNLSHQMMPKSLMELGLLSAFHDLIDKSFKYASIKPTFEYYNLEKRFSENVEVTVYRIAQELINNVIKHSGATEINIQLFADRKNLRLLIEDNGKGLNSEKAEGHGIFNIKNRLEMVGGKINYENGPENGTIASVTIPIQYDK